MIHIIPSKTELKLKQLKRFGRSLPFPYQALQSFMKFKVHARDIAFDAESLADLHRLEVRVVRAVAAAGHRDELAIVDVRITLLWSLRHSSHSTSRLKMPW